MGAKVTLPYDPEWKALKWAKENCPSYITNQGSDSAELKRVPGGWVNVTWIDYYFGNEQDATLFSLKWL